MNLYLRLFITLLNASRGAPLRPGETFELAFRVLPNDLDVNGHMNNGRYLTIVDLGMVTLFVRSGFARLCLARRWRPMGGGSIVYFRRALTILQSYRLRFSLVAWDEFWSYCRFDFVRSGEVCATGFIKGAAVAHAGLVRTADIYPALGHHYPSPAMPEDLAAWIAADQAVGLRTRC